MSITVISILIAISIFLLIVELLIVPGVTVAGIGGFILMVAGVLFAYKFHGSRIGNIFLFSSMGVAFVALMFSLRTKTWKNVGLKSEINGRIENIEKDSIKEGDSGKTVTRLAPIGRAVVNNIFCEAKSLSEFIDENTEIIVTKIKNNQIIVKPKNKK